ncbi:thiopeptide-type bacteriocin biosynthesis protein [Saccharothrix longispora]|uniref:Thiopeptide-type bacteriocin biosynthesis protein n=1 Tax=Saccharothrix longispora TaxID=33920 RepID=A0ABU1PV19_9PSEU|nr:thiopeptide-type bacteriocin biosynthesis protein [Saccharothrix longispora]MDR6594481.1 thiopeptide-type bacteriocin biosynthesis protein [Saccharothrix longispora]
MAEPAGWVSAHIFHRGDQDLLITSALAPVCQELTRAGRVDSWFFLRYWEGGPHVRLRLHATAHADEVRAIVARTCRHHLATHPSPPDDWSQHSYEPLARRLANGERMSRWDNRLRPVDTVEFSTYRPEHHAYGDGAALAAVERHFTESSLVAVPLLTADPQRRAAVALAMLTLAVAVCQPDPARAGAGLAALRAPQPPEFYRAHRDELRDQARHLWPLASSAPTSADPLAVWARSVHTLHAALTRARAEDGFTPTDALSPFASLARALRPEDPAVPYVVLRCAHLLCNRLGMPTATESQLASLTARTLSELDCSENEVTTP